MIYELGDKKISSFVDHHPEQLQTFLQNLLIIVNN